MSLQHQVHCEAAATLLAVEHFASHLETLTVIHFTDCQLLTQAFRNGSTAGSPLHTCARSLWELTAWHRIDLTPVWLPGTEMVDNGTDALSRDLAVDKHPYSLPVPALNALLHAFPARTDVPTISMDWFTDATSAQAPCFFTCLFFPTAEGTDAFAAPSWHSTPCPC
eukprot:393415-Rhodomonas_salina.2